MKKTLILIATGLILFSLHAVGQSKADYGKELLAQGKTAEAVGYLLGLLQNTPRDYQAWYWLALSYQKQGKLDSAEFAARKTVSIEDEFPDGFVALTRILAERKDLAGAYTTAKTGLKVNKKIENPLLLVELGNVLLLSDSVDAALVAFSRVKELDPANPTGYSGAGKCYVRLGVGPMAAAEFEKSLLADSLQPALLYALANVYLKDRQYTDAARAYSRLLAQQPENQAARLELARLYYRAKQWRNCVATLKDHFAKNPNPPADVASMYMEALYNARQFGEVIPIAQNFVKAQPKSVLGLRILAHAQAIEKQYAASIENYNQLAALDTLTSEDLVRLGRSYRQVKKDSLAAMSYEQALVLDTTQATLYGEAGSLWMSLKNWARAAEMFKKRYQLDTTAIAAYINYGACMMQLEKYEEAAAAFEEAIKQNPQYPPSYTSLASCYFAMKKPADGRDVAEKAIQAVDTAKTRWRFELADAYRLIGLSYLLDKKWEEGVKNLRESLKYKDDAPQTWLLLGQGLQNQQKNKEAYDAYKRVLKYDPKNEIARKAVEILQLLVE